ncbi:MAG TPA: hypothetical protein VG710_14500 [Opitutus sp.]|nr:hypothetical protein [Opitutus sp.]
MPPKIAVLFAATLVFSGGLFGGETFVGSFAEPRDGGTLDTAHSTFDGRTVTIVPRAEANEAVGNVPRWRNIYFAIRGLRGKAPVFRLPLASRRAGGMILANDDTSFRNVRLVWSYDGDGAEWHEFDRYTRTGRDWTDWRIDAQNRHAFTRDVVYVSINERFPVGDFYSWLKTKVFTHPLVEPTPSETLPGSFIIGYESGAPASAACSRPIPDTPLFAFQIREPHAHPRRLVVLVSGQHPYEGQNKIALEGALEWILNSTSDAARRYRANYVTLVYPFVNPTGELAGLWRGTARAPDKDTNRNWQTAVTDPGSDPAIDTVIIHRNAMQKDIAALGLGEPYAAFDYHQNFGDREDAPDYVMHSTPAPRLLAVAARGPVAHLDFESYFRRLTSRTRIADMPSDLSDEETLRGYMIDRGALLPLTFERSVYHDLATEREFGAATVQALVESVPAPAAELASKLAAGERTPMRPSS